VGGHLSGGVIIYKAGQTVGADQLYEPTVEARMSISGKCMTRAIRIVALALMLAAPILLAQTIHGASRAKTYPFGASTASTWDSVAASGDSLFWAADGGAVNLYTRSLGSDIAVPFFTTQYLLPQTLNEENLSAFLAMEHEEYHLDGWFFLGQLIEGEGEPPLPSEISTFAISVQRKDIAQIPDTSIRLAVFPSMVIFQGPRHEGYLYGGALDLAPQVTVTSDPWSVVAVADGDYGMISMALAEGRMGMKDAVYHLAADVVDQEERRLQTDVWIRDVFGVINNGYGPASFYPQWITPEQREKIISEYGGSLEAYLVAENDPMVCQGDYYYSTPQLEVLYFRVTRDGDEVLTEGRRGRLWMDYTVASYDERASEMVKYSKWQWFAIQFTQFSGSNSSLMVLNTETLKTEALPVARFYRDEVKSLNGAINATYTWDIDKISITPVEGSVWKSPATGITYYTKYDIDLLSGDPAMNAHLTVAMVRDDSELYFPGENPMYEGAGTVSGTFGSETIAGYVFAEFEQTYLDPTWNNDYNGDGTSDIGIFRGSTGLWAIRGVTRVYFGTSSDTVVPGDYDGDGTTNVGIFRPATGLWAIRQFTRSYFGQNGDSPQPGDYDGNGTWDIGVFRAASGLWAVRGVTSAFFGASGDTPVPGYYDRSTPLMDFGIFRPSSGLWEIRGVTRAYFGSSVDTVVPGDYNDDGRWDIGIFRPSSGLWSIRNVTRMYLGSTNDWPLPADYDGNGVDDAGIFRDSAGMWSIRNLTRVYFGAEGDIPVTR